jgi:hypothetical protein
MKRTALAFFVALILVSALTFASAVWLDAGHSNTPDGTQDSKGHPLGFNDRLTWELCGTMFRNASLETIWEVAGIYGLAYFLAHLAGFSVLLLTRKRATSKTRERFFLLQLLLFPTGWLGALMMFPIVLSFLAGTADGETISDGLPLWWAVQPVWFVVSLVAALHSFWNRWPVSTPQADAVNVSLRQSGAP